MKNRCVPAELPALRSFSLALFLLKFLITFLLNLLLSCLPSFLSFVLDIKFYIIDFVLTDDRINCIDASLHNTTHSAVVSTDSGVQFSFFHFALSR